MAKTLIPQGKQMAMGLKPAKTGASGVGRAGIKAPAGKTMNVIAATRSAPGLKSSPPTGKGFKLK